MPIIVDLATPKKPIPVSTIIYRAGVLLLDEDHIRWTTAELLSWINEGASAIVAAKPAAGARAGVLSLAGGTLQLIESPITQLIDVVRNIGADGVTPGRAIRRTDRSMLDSVLPDWHLSAQSSTIKHFVYDDRNPSAFYVFPPAAPGVKVEVAYAVLPDEVTDLDGGLDMTADYAEPLLNFVLYRCFAKDSEYANGNVAAGYYQAFQASLGINTAGEQSVSPNAKVPA